MQLRRHPIRTGLLLLAVVALTVLSGLLLPLRTNAATVAPDAIEFESFAGFDSGTGVYRDTLRGFSIKLPSGWLGTEITSDSQFLSAQDDPDAPTFIASAYLFESNGNDAETAMNDVADTLLEVRTDALLISSSAINASTGTTAHRILVEWRNTAGTDLREEWIGFVRGSNFVALKVLILASDYGIRLAQINEFIDSFVWETPAPYGASKTDSMFLAGGEIRTIDPALYRGAAAGIPGELFSGLVMLDTDIKVAPEIASSWDIDESGLVYTFNLNPLAVFHDGSQITASDVKYSWERAADPITDSPTVLTYLGDIVGIDAMNSGDATEVSGLVVLDDLTLQVTIEKPIQYFLQKLTYPTAFVVDKIAVEAGGEDWTDAPNGSGPFKLKRWDKDEVMVLERHEAHYTTVPKLKNIVYLLFAGRPMTMYENDEIDMVGVGGANVDRVLDPANALNADLYVGDNFCSNYLWFNTSSEPFDDINIRRAFATSIDIDRMIEVSHQGRSTRSTSLLPPGISGYAERPNAIRFDPDTARQTIDGSTIRDQTIPSYSASGSFLWMWEYYLGVGFTSIEVMESQDWLDRRDAGEFLFGTTGWCADYPDPQNFLEILFHSESQENSTGFADPEFDRLVDEASVEPDFETRNALYRQAEDLLIDNYVMVPLWRGQTRFLAKPWVKNVQVAPIGIRQSHLYEIQR